MRIPLPAWTHTLPQPQVAPDPRIVEHLLPPLANLFPVMVDAYAHGEAKICLHPHIVVDAISNQRVFFAHDEGPDASHHTRLGDPWRRPGTTGRLHALEAAGIAVADTVSALFGNTLTCRAELRIHTGNHGPIVGLHLTTLILFVPADPDGPLHMATLLATLHAALLNGRPAHILAHMLPHHAIATSEDGRPIVISFQVPGTDAADQQRVRDHASMLGHHISQALGTPFVG